MAGHYTFYSVRVVSSIIKTDRKLSKGRSASPDCPLSKIIPNKKETKYHLSLETELSAAWKLIDRLTNVFVNKLILKSYLSSFTIFYDWECD